MLALNPVIAAKVVDIHVLGMKPIARDMVAAILVLTSPKPRNIGSLESGLMLLEKSSDVWVYTKMTTKVEQADRVEPK